METLEDVPLKDNETEIGVIAAFFAMLQSKQEPLGADFEKVLYLNLWDLYE